MRRTRLLAAAITLLIPAIAMAGQPNVADLAHDMAQLKQQLGELHQAKGLKIGAVDIVQVFDNLDEKYEMNIELRKEEDRREGELRGLAKRIKDLTDAMKLLRADSTEYKRNAQELEELKSDFRSRRDATEDKLYNRLFDFTHNIYKKIRDEIAGYAREGGYDLVLRVRDPDIGSFDQALRPRHKYLELNRRIEYRGVLYHKPALDFTQAIVDRLNAKYRREKDERSKAQPGTKPDPAPAPKGKGPE